MRLMRLPRSVVSATAVAVVLVFTGCKPEDEIRAYTAPKEPTAKIETPAAADDKYRMLGAVIPAESGYWWFVKFVGPSEVVSPLKADFDAFVAGIKPDEKKPTWTAPPKWTEAPARQTRLATYTNGSAEMYLSGPFGGTLLDNVNRWRREVGLRELKEAELNATLTEVKLGDKTAWTVDLRGPSWSGGMGGGKGPFQK
jgi:hypothetical protein